MRSSVNQWGKINKIKLYTLTLAPVIELENLALTYGLSVCMIAAFLQPLKSDRPLAASHPIIGAIAKANDCSEGGTLR